MKCRSCGSESTFPLIDMGSAPPSNAYLTPVTLRRPEKWFPLKVWVCESCWLVQTEIYSRSAELFNDEYAYFSSTSQSWLDHAQNYVKMALDRFALTPESFVVEIASNDGYLLQYVQQAGIRCVGVEPTASTAQSALAKGIPTKQEFFDRAFAEGLVLEYGYPDLVVANNVIAHVPEIDDFMQGVKVLLEGGGTATFEFPHLLNLIEQTQFDTIYHEHFYYYSLTSLIQILSKNGLHAVDLEELPTHGGSLRVYVKATDGQTPFTSSLQNMLEVEEQKGLFTRSFYQDFANRAEKIKDDFLQFLLSAKSEGKKVAGYGAAAKGNTLLNWAGVKTDLIEFVVDQNPAKQGKFLPGSRIPIYAVDELQHAQVHILIVFPWNLLEEIAITVAPNYKSDDLLPTLVTATPKIRYVGLHHKSFPV